jgi:hypothetical protein
MSKRPNNLSLISACDRPAGIRTGRVIGFPTRTYSRLLLIGFALGPTYLNAYLAKERLHLMREC